MAVQLARADGEMGVRGWNGATVRLLFLPVGKNKARCSYSANLLLFRPRELLPVRSRFCLSAKTSTPKTKRNQQDASTTFLLACLALAKLEAGGSTLLS